METAKKTNILNKCKCLPKKGNTILSWKNKKRAVSASAVVFCAMRTTSNMSRSALSAALTKISVEDQQTGVHLLDKATSA